MSPRLLKEPPYDFLLFTVSDLCSVDSEFYMQKVGFTD